MQQRQKNDYTDKKMAYDVYNENRKKKVSFHFVVHLLQLTARKNAIIYRYFALVSRNTLVTSQYDEARLC